MNTEAIPVDEVVVGDTLIYPCWVGPRVEHLPRTVSSIVEYPRNRVLYFVNSLFGIVARTATVDKVVDR